MNSLRGINPSQIVTVEFAQDWEDVGVGTESRIAKVDIHSRLKDSLRRGNMLEAPRVLPVRLSVYVFNGFSDSLSMPMREKENNE